MIEDNPRPSREEAIDVICAIGNASQRAQKRPEVGSSDWVEELEAAIRKAKGWHKANKHKLNKEEEAWLNELEKVAEGTLRAWRSGSSTKQI